MTAHQVAYRYAKALFRLTLVHNELEIALQHLQQCVDLLNQNLRLNHFFFTPQYSPVEKKPVLVKLLEGRIQPHLLNFLVLLLEKGRLQCLPDIVKEYQRMIADHLKYLEVTVMTVVPMGVEVKEKLKSKLSRAYQREIVLKEEIVPQMIGGVIIVINNQMLDFSIKNRLIELKEALLSIPV